MKTYIVILIFIIGTDDLSAQKTVEKIGKAAEVINTTGSVIKSLGGLLGKKNKRTDTMKKVSATTMPTANNVEINIPTQGAKILDRNFVAKTVFGKQKTELDILWKAHPEEKIDVELVSQLISDDGYYHTEVSELIEFEEKGIKNATALLITYNYHKDEKGKLKKNESRGSSPGIGFANFNHTEDGNWNFVKMNRLVSRVGSDGQIPDFERINLGNSLNTLSFTNSYGMGGQNETHQTLYALNANYLGKLIFDIALLESWEGGYTKNNPAYEIKRSYKILENDTASDYPILLVNGVKNKKSLPAVWYFFSEEKAKFIQKTSAVTAKMGAKKSITKNAISSPVKKTTPAVTKSRSTVKKTSTSGTTKSN
ncbi:MAG: hypothetical protein EOP00_18780 [Pedobacter sp.]|nr:MAG: hypothetical protein EOP00_18780 [Pedobacter sp.]